MQNSSLVGIKLTQYQPSWEHVKQKNDDIKTKLPPNIHSSHIWSILFRGYTVKIQQMHSLLKFYSISKSYNTRSQIDELWAIKLAGSKNVAYTYLTLVLQKSKSSIAIWKLLFMIKGTFNSSHCHSKHLGKPDKHVSKVSKRLTNLITKNKTVRLGM